jgi:PIN domain nuclease of toxin-antitoxin system
MRYLLDTHTFLWLNASPQKLGSTARDKLTAGEAPLFLSIVSPWEIQIKQQLGKLELESPLADMLDAHLGSRSIQLLPIELSHIERLGTLEQHHRDPFDRMLIAQALVEGLSIISADSAFAAYPVKQIW